MTDGNQLRFYGAIIRVRDLHRARVFYSDVLGLGTPAVDSNFWIEYEPAPGRPVLALEQSGSAVGSEPGRVSWCLEVDDLSAREERLRQHGVRMHGVRDLPTGRRVLFFLDPEQNPLALITRQMEQG